MRKRKYLPEKLKLKLNVSTCHKTLARLQNQVRVKKESGMEMFWKRLILSSCRKTVERLYNQVKDP